MSTSTPVASITPGDFLLVNHRSVSILTPLNCEAQRWVDEHLPSDALTWGRNGVVIEPRYVSDIVEGILGDGLSLC